MVRKKNLADVMSVLDFLYKFQGEWTSLWNGHFKGRDDEMHCGKKIGFVNDVFYAMPAGTTPRRALAVMRYLHFRGLVGGCPCGCRGDFEITDRGLALLGRARFTDYTGYGERRE